MAINQNKMGNTVTAAIWAVAARWVFRALGLVSTIVLARLLTPADFGLVAIATSIMALVEALSDFNFGVALVKYQDASRDEYDTAWCLNVLRGSVIAVLFAISAPIFSSVFSEPRLNSVFYIISSTVVLNGFVSINMINLQKYLQLNKEFVFRVSTKLGSVIITIVLALIYKNYWALILGSLFETTLRVAFSFILAPYHPRWSLRSHKRLFAFSGGLMIVNVLNVFWSRAEQLALGYFSPSNAVGLYKVGQEIGGMPVGEIAPPLMRVFFPTLARVQDDREELQRLINQAAAILGTLLLPVGLGFALVADKFVMLILGERWLEAIIIIQVFSILSAFTLLLGPAQYAILVRGKVKVLIGREIVTCVGMLMCVVPGAIFLGIMGVLYARIAAEFIRLLYVIWAVRQYADFQLQRFFLGLWRPFVSVAFMFVCVLYNGRILTVSEHGLEQGVTLVLQIFTGAASYTTLLFFLWYICGKPDGPEAFLLSRARGLAFKGWRRKPQI